jgi:hypothetical protein
VKSQLSEIIPELGLSPTMSGQPHRNFAVKNFLEQAPCAPQFGALEFIGTRAMAVPIFSSAQAFGEVGLGKAIGPQRTRQAARR